MEELKSLFSEDKVVEIAGSKIKIKEAETQHLPLVLAVAEKVIAAASKGGNKAEIVSNVLGTISKDFKLVYGLLEGLTDLPKDKIPKLNLAAMMLILKHVVEVNVDFLSLHLTPVMKEFNLLVEKYRGQQKSKG